DEPIPVEAAEAVEVADAQEAMAPGAGPAPSPDGAPVGRSRRSLAFAPLRHRNYALVWWAGLISNVGTWMETVAVGDLVADRTGQAGWTALVAAAGFLPMGLLGPVGGALADRLDRRRMLITMSALQM